jgi:hypothetical protein
MYEYKKKKKEKDTTAHAVKFGILSLTFCAYVASALPIF